MSARKKTATTEAEPIRATVVTDEEIADVNTEAEAPAAAPEPEPEAIVYLGPDIDRLVNHGTVYERGIIPEYLEKKIKEVPAIKGLLVPISRYAEVAREITLPEGRYRTLYDIVSKAN